VNAEATANAPVLGVDLGGAPARAEPSVQGAPAAVTSTDHRTHTGQTAKLQMAHAGHSQAQGTGTVKAVDAAQRTVTLSHGPIAALGWPAMTMDFPVAGGVDLQNVSPGMRVNFRIEHGADDRYVIQSLTPAHGGH
jgi:Cu/Ag efflux protein CusF